mmetsp:Transcript_90969/g.273249  ORF Transcript_90969/g.273249 Transcript_90969/m.273249 type:complete len:204 (-) Transcript_90969:451-1062(-)
MHRYHPYTLNNPNVASLDRSPSQGVEGGEAQQHVRGQSIAPAFDSVRERPRISAHGMASVVVKTDRAAWVSTLHCRTSAGSHARVPSRPPPPSPPLSPRARAGPSGDSHSAPRASAHALAASGSRKTRAGCAGQKVTSVRRISAFCHGPKSGSTKPTLASRASRAIDTASLSSAHGSIAPVSRKSWRRAYSPSTARSAAHAAP